MEHRAGFDIRRYDSGAPSRSGDRDTPPSVYMMLMKLKFLFSDKLFKFVESNCWGPNLDERALEADTKGIMWWGPLFKGKGARLLFWNRFRAII